MIHEYHADVVRAVDGDTVDLIIQLGFNITIRERFRLTGIDTPERGQPGWEEATTRLVEMMANGLSRVQTQKTDKYGRWLAVLWDNEGTNINQLMVDEGFAKVYSVK